MPNIGWPELLIIAVLFALIVSTIGARAGGRRWVWAVLGFFFPLIALIVLAVLRPINPKPTTSVV
jgi:hypothetical protein